MLTGYRPFTKGFGLGAVGRWRRQENLLWILLVMMMSPTGPMTLPIQADDIIKMRVLNIKPRASNV